MNSELLHLLPPPPPWRREGGVFINDITGEQTDQHPLQQHLDQQQHPLQEQQDTEREQCEGDAPEEKEFCGGEHLDYRCEWKEVGLMGNTLSYGLTLRYFLEDKHFEMVFDGVDAVWKYSKLDGRFGPVDEYDLFIGSKLTLFGRHLSISSTNCDICRLIDKKEQQLKKQRAYLQDKVEMLGAIPCVRRATQDRVRNITRSSAKTGHGNLRQLRNECLKLCEQMGELGLTHLIK